MQGHREVIPPVVGVGLVTPTQLEVTKVMGRIQIMETHGEDVDQGPRAAENPNGTRRHIGSSPKAKAAAIGPETLQSMSMTTHMANTSMGTTTAAHGRTRVVVNSLTTANADDHTMTVQNPTLVRIRLYKGRTILGVTQGITPIQNGAPTKKMLMKAPMLGTTVGGQTISNETIGGHQHLRSRFHRVDHTIVGTTVGTPITVVRTTVGAMIPKLRVATVGKVNLTDKWA